MSSELSMLYDRFNEYKRMNLSLNMARGKPGRDQLDISNDMLDPDLLGNYKSEDGTEIRNYGVLDGITECKRLYSEILQVPEKNIIVFGNASLTIMYDYIAQCMIFGAGSEPWAAQDGIKFLCPVPGYDRHFAILEHFGIDMINIPMNADGPDMDLIDEYIKDEHVKGIICVPMYANPNGITYSEDVIKRFAALKPAAEDFRVIWDNAYCVHHLSDDADPFYNIFEYAYKCGTEDLFIEVASTSKISFPGAGISVMAASDKNIECVKKRLSIQTIGYDKINQLRHAAYFKNIDGIKEHMKKHAAIIKPKFDAVLDILSDNFSGNPDYTWTEPKGGYFISFNVPAGCAKRTVELCKEAGVTLTGAGATYPYQNDPADSNIRIAPTFPDLDELKLATEILCLCAKIAALEAKE